jgi:hypothetical protein
MKQKHTRNVDAMFAPYHACRPPRVGIKAVGSLSNVPEGLGRIDRTPTTRFAIDSPSRANSSVGARMGDLHRLPTMRV